MNLDPIKIEGPVYSSNNPRNPQNNRPEALNTPRGGISEVDYDLPRTRMRNPDAIAVIIGNSHYQKTKAVNYAINDARSIRNYLLDVMGYQEANIIHLEDASYSDFKLIFGSKENLRGRLFNLIKPEKSDVFIFYAGHGAPGLKDQQAYFVPVECDPQYVELTGFPADVIYNNLAQLPARSVVMVLDACFSGENIYDNISPIVIKSKGALGLKDGALLASSQADQVSTWYPEKGHSMFTYFFLKALHNQNADANHDKQLSLMEIYTYIANQTEGLPYYARRLHGIDQMPVLKGKIQKKYLWFMNNSNLMYMKAFYIVLLGLLLCIGSPAYAQEKLRRYPKAIQSRRTGKGI
ncbi:MAG: caspase family protein [Bacteroidia bacterium]|nr:caspase family protein [Bacteroidia bacterium]